jgi:hypothetical protein
MRRYGDLALEILEQENGLPNSADWTHRRLQPTVDAMRLSPHDIKWSEIPHLFREWIETERIKGYEKVLDHICRTISKPTVGVEKVNPVGHFKSPHLWPPQKPPPRTVRIVI